MKWKVDVENVLAVVMVILVSVILVFSFIERQFPVLTTQTPSPTKPVLYIERTFYDKETGVACYSKCYDLAGNLGSICDPITCVEDCK